jgi:hypothetical protein
MYFAGINQSEDESFKLIENANLVQFLAMAFMLPWLKDWLVGDRGGGFGRWRTANTTMS